MDTTTTRHAYNALDQALMKIDVAASLLDGAQAQEATVIGEHLSILVNDLHDEIYGS